MLVSTLNEQHIIIVVVVVKNLLSSDSVAKMLHI